MHVRNMYMHIYVRIHIKCESLHYVSLGPLAYSSSLSALSCEQIMSLGTYMYMHIRKYMYVTCIQQVASRGLWRLNKWRLVVCLYITSRRLYNKWRLVVCMYIHTYTYIYKCLSALRLTRHSHRPRARPWPHSVVAGKKERKKGKRQVLCIMHVSHRIILQLQGGEDA